MSGRPAPGGRGARTSLIDIVAPDRLDLTICSPNGVAVRLVLVLLGAAGAMLSGSKSDRDLIVGLPVISAMLVLRAVQARSHPGPTWAIALLPNLLAETVIIGTVVLGTGVGHSPWIVVLLGQMGLVGASLPSRVAGPVAAGGLVVLLLASLTVRPFFREHGWFGSACLLALVACTFAYASWLFARSERHRALLAEANHRLASTNAMLVGLDRASPRDGEDFDSRRCARSVAATARMVLEAETIVVLASTALPDRWQVLHTEGAHFAEVVDERAFDALGRFAAAEDDGSTGPLRIDYRCSPYRPANPASATGLLLPLRMHDRLVGALLLEHSTPSKWGMADSALVADLGERAALMLDNARRFNALWVVGATEERTRVAHDLHDHLGQSMAALGLELDVLARRLDDDEVRRTLKELRCRVTGMVGELRSTMRDLRCDVSADRDLAHVLSGLVRDFDGRSDATVEFEARGEGRLPLAQEHQLLLVARQALTTAVVDAGAGKVRVRWTCDGDTGRLEVGHDGGDAASRTTGDLQTAANLRALSGIEERCRAIGARLSVDPSGSITCEVQT